MHSDLRSRLGSFFIILGLCILLIFIFSLLAGNFRFDFLFSCSLFLYLGSRFHAKGNQTTVGSRFKMIRGINSRYKQRKEEKLNQDNQIED